MGPGVRQDDGGVGLRNALRRCTKTKSPIFRPGFSHLFLITLSGGFIGDGGVVAIGIIALVGGTFGFAFPFACSVGLDAATRALGELALDFLDRFGLGRVLNHRDFAREAIERRFI